MCYYHACIVIAVHVLVKLCINFVMIMNYYNITEKCIKPDKLNKFGKIRMHWLLPNWSTKMV